MAPYVILNNRIRQFQVLTIRSEGLSPLSQLKTSADSGGLLVGEKRVENAEFNRFANTCETLRDLYCVFPTPLPDIEL